MAGKSCTFGPAIGDEVTRAPRAGARERARVLCVRTVSVSVSVSVVAHAKVLKA